MTSDEREKRDARLLGLTRVVLEFAGGREAADDIRSLLDEARELREALTTLADAVAALEGEPIAYPLTIPLGVALVRTRQVTR